MSRDVNYIDVNSEVVRQIGEHRIRCLFEMACHTINRIRERYGDDVADRVTELGNDITTDVDETVRSCAKESGLDGLLVAYLESAVSANIATSIISAVDEAQFKLDLEQFQGGAE